jgi:predicted PurR-regulated permease PerM
MSLSFWHLILSVWVWALFALVLVVPVSKVLRRVGFSGWWSVLALVPLVNIIALWAFAFMRWPIEQAAR